jgi:hypothetical protein
VQVTCGIDWAEDHHDIALVAGAGRDVEYLGGHDKVLHQVDVEGTCSIWRSTRTAGCGVLRPGVREPPRRGVRVGGPHHRAHQAPDPVAEAVATTTDWLGSWDFGVAVTGLRWLTSWRPAQHHHDYLAAPFSEHDYQETVRATYERVVKDPDGIVADLTGRLNRGLGGSAPIPQ